MSTGLLYHAFGVRGYEYVSTEYSGATVTFHARQRREDLRCPECGSARVIAHGSTPRTFKMVPIGHKPVRLSLPVPRVECRDCGIIRQVEVAFADSRRSYSRSFERYVLELCRVCTIQDVAHHLQIGWDTVKDILKRDLSRRFDRPLLRHMTRLAIDEICIGGGHKYLTVVPDLDSGAVVFVGDGKGADALKPFWKRLRRSKAEIQAVAGDMGPAYIAAVQENLPEATIVFDHFHVVKLFNEKLSDLRRELYREATEQLHKDVLKGTRWLLLKNPENLDPKRNEKQRLEDALKLNAPLATAYLMKEDLRQLWGQADKTAAEAFLEDWIERAEASGIGMLKKFAKTLAAHRSGILAYYDHPISTGPLEGTNNKIKTLNRQAYGYRDIEFFKLRILACHESKYCLVG